MEPVKLLVELCARLDVPDIRPDEASGLLQLPLGGDCVMTLWPEARGSRLEAVRENIEDHSKILSDPDHMFAELFFGANGLGHFPKESLKDAVDVAKANVLEQASSLQPAAAMNALENEIVRLLKTPETDKVSSEAISERSGDWSVSERSGEVSDEQRSRSEPR